MLSRVGFRGLVVPLSNYMQLNLTKRYSVSARESYTIPLIEAPDQLLTLSPSAWYPWCQRSCSTPEANLHEPTMGEDLVDLI